MSNVQHPSGFTPMLVHTDADGVKTMVLDNLRADDIADVKGLASETEWQLRQKDGDYLGEYIQGGTVSWSLNEDPGTNEKWLCVRFDPR